MREWIARLLGLFRKRSMRERLDRELALHRDLLAEDLASRQAAPSSAVLRRELGPASFRDAYEDQAGVPWLEHLWQDARYAVRGMRRTPAISLVVIATLALGIGVNTAIFSVVNSVLIEPLPYPGLGTPRVAGGEHRRGARDQRDVAQLPQLATGESHVRDDGRVPVRPGDADRAGRGANAARDESRATTISPCMGMQPLLGRLFTDADDRPGSAATVVLNHRSGPVAWVAIPSIVGTTLTLDGRPYDVVGVAAPVWEARPVDYYLPLGRVSGSDADRGRHSSMRVLGRLQTGCHAGGRSGRSRHHHAASGRCRLPVPKTIIAAFGRMLADQTRRRRPGNAARADGCRGPRAAHRLREHRQPPARPRHDSARPSLRCAPRLVRAEDVSLVSCSPRTSLLSIVGGGAGLLLARWTLAVLIALAPQDIPQAGRDGTQRPGAVPGCSGLAAHRPDLRHGARH